MTEELLKFIKDKTGIELTEESLVFEDLGLDGLDAETFMLEFAAHFNVDLTTFRPDRYFSSEYELANIFLTMYRAIFNRRKLKKEAFHLSHLIKVIEMGKWVDPTH